MSITRYWMDIFHIKLLKNCSILLKKSENKHKWGWDFPFTEYVTITMYIMYKYLSS